MNLRQQIGDSFRALRATLREGDRLVARINVERDAAAQKEKAEESGLQQRIAELEAEIEQGRAEEQRRQWRQQREWQQQRLLTLARRYGSSFVGPDGHGGEQYGGLVDVRQAGEDVLLFIFREPSSFRVRSFVAELGYQVIPESVGMRWPGAFRAVTDANMRDYLTVFAQDWGGAVPIPVTD